MSAPILPSTLSLFRLALNRASQLEPRVLVFGQWPPNEESRDVPYLVVDPDPGWDQVDRGDGRVSSRRGRFHVRACGSSTEQAALALDAARDVFLNWRPYADLRFGMAREEEADGLTIDRSVPTSPRFVFGLTYEIDD